MKTPAWNTILAKPVLGVGMLGGMSKVLQAVAGILLAYRLGADHTTDAYTVAKSLPIGAYLVADSLLYHGLVPMWSHRTEPLESGRRFLGAVLLGTLLAAVALTLVLGAVAGPLLRWMLPGASAETVEQAAALCRVMALALPAALPASLLKAWNASRGRYGYAALDALFMHITLIVALLWLPAGWGIWPVAAALPSAFFVLAAVQVFGARTDFRPAVPRDTGSGLRELGGLLGPLLGINVLLQANVFFMNAAASYTGEGSVSCMLYSYTMAQAPVSLLDLILLSTLFPYAAMLSSEKRYADFRTAFHSVTRMLLFVLIPLGVWMAVYREEITALLLERGHFDAADAHRTALCFLGHSLAVACWALEAFAYRCLFALKRHIDYLRIAAVRVIVNIVGCAVSIPWLGLLGVVLAFAVSYAVGATLACNSVSRLLDAAGSRHRHILSKTQGVLLVSMAMATGGVGMGLRACLEPYPVVVRLAAGATACGILIAGAYRIGTRDRAPRHAVDTGNNE